MTNFNNSDWEKKLRALPTTLPPAEMRARIFARLPRRKPVWNRPLAYALCLMFLLAINFGLQYFQEARLNCLMGDGGMTRLTEKTNPKMLLAYLQNRNQLYHLSVEETP
jgi:hypothetical protein